MYYDIKELERIVDECIIEIQSKDKLEKEFEEFDKMTNQVDNNTIFNEMTKMRSDFVDGKKSAYNMDVTILKKAQQNNDLLKEILTKNGKWLFIVTVLVFLCGVITGMQDQVWIPYLREVLDFAKTASNVIK